MIEVFGQGLESAAGPLCEFSDADGALVKVVNCAGFAAVTAEKGNSTYDLLRGEGRCQQLLVAEAVLQGQDCGFVGHQRADKFNK